MAAATALAGALNAAFALGRLTQAAIFQRAARGDIGGGAATLAPSTPNGPSGGGMLTAPTLTLSRHAYAPGRKHATHRRRAGRANRAARLVAAVAMVKSGHTVKVAAKTHRVKYTDVRNACISTGVPLPHATRVVAPGIWENVDWSLRDTDLARLLRVSREWVRRKRKELGQPKVGKKPTTAQNP
jgi:hypothetical protein